MGRYDVEQRVMIVAGPHLRCTGLTMSCYDPSDPQSRAEVDVELDSSGRRVRVRSCDLRPVVYGADSSGLGDAT